MSICDRRKKPPPLLVLAGGFGTRLQSVVKDVPKPLAEVYGKPFIYYLLTEWLECGVTDFVFLLHYKAEMLDDYVSEFFESNNLPQVSYKCIIEPKPLGTGGAVRYAIEQIEFPEEIIVVNADTWLPGAVRALISAEGNCVAATWVNDVSRFGSLQISNDRVTDFLEKEGGDRAGYINGGSYRLSTQSWKSKLVGTVFGIEDEVLVKLARANELRFVSCDSGFIDIGVPADYTRFTRWIERGRSGEI